MTKLKNQAKRLMAKVGTKGMSRRALAEYSNGLATVFMIHRASGIHEGIGGHDPQKLEAVLIKLKNSAFNLVSLEDVIKAAQGHGDLPGQSIAFTMDDGYHDQIEVLAPIFAKYEVPLTVFLTTGFLNRELWTWDAKIQWLLQQNKKRYITLKFENHQLSWQLGSQQDSRLCRRELQGIYGSLSYQKAERFLERLKAEVEVEIPINPPPEFSPASWDQVRQLEGAGIRFAPHTHTHRILSQLSEDQARFELSRSLEVINTETRFGIPVLSYPVGLPNCFGFREMRLAENIGFIGAFTACSDYSNWQKAKGFPGLRYNLNRFGMPDRFEETCWLATGMEDLIKSFRSIKNNILKTKSLPIIEKPSGNSAQFNTLKKIDANRVNRLVFVCRGNVCRSPYAEAVAMDKGFPAVSCGIDVSYSAPAQATGGYAAFLRGKNLSEHMSRSIFNLDIQKTDCLVAINPSHLPTTREIALRINCQVTLLGLWQKPSINIKDPYGGDLDDFQQCFCKIDEVVEVLIAYLKGERNYDYDYNLRNLVSIGT